MVGEAGVGWGQAMAKHHVLVVLPGGSSHKQRCTSVETQSLEGWKLWRGELWDRERCRTVRCAHLLVLVLIVTSLSVSTMKAAEKLPGACPE